MVTAPPAQNRIVLIARYGQSDNVALSKKRVPYSCHGADLGRWLAGFKDWCSGLGRLAIPIGMRFYQCSFPLRRILETCECPQHHLRRHALSKAFHYRSSKCFSRSGFKQYSIGAPKHFRLHFPNLYNALFYLFFCDDTQS